MAPAVSTSAPDASEVHAGLQAEDRFLITLPDQAIDCWLIMRTLDLTQQQPHGTAVATAVELALGGYAPADAPQSHGILFLVERKRGQKRPLVAR